MDLTIDEEKALTDIKLRMFNAKDVSDLALIREQYDASIIAKAYSEISPNVKKRLHDLKQGVTTNHTNPKVDGWEVVMDEDYFLRVLSMFGVTKYEELEWEDMLAKIKENLIDLGFLAKRQRIDYVRKFLDVPKDRTIWDLCDRHWIVLYYYLNNAVKNISKPSNFKSDC